MTVYYNKVIQRIVKDQAEIIFKELSSGIYETLKSEVYKLPEFVNSSLIVTMLNKDSKIYVIGLDGTYYNFELEGFGH